MNLEDAHELDLLPFVVITLAIAAAVWVIVKKARAEE